MLAPFMKSRSALSACDRRCGERAAPVPEIVKSGMAQFGRRSPCGLLTLACRGAVVAPLLCAFDAPLAAGYVMSARSDGATAIDVSPGAEFPIDVWLEASGTAGCDAVLARLQASAPGLTILAYEWSMPFVGGGIFDLSTPSPSLLPVEWVESTLAGPGYPAGSVDLEIANYTLASGFPPPLFSEGIVVRVWVKLTAPWDGPDALTVSPIPDQVVDGFTDIPTVAGQSLSISVGRVLPGGDLNGDGVIGAADLAILLGQWGGPCPQIPQDLNDDNVVDAQDLAVFVSLWGTSGPAGDFDGDGIVGDKDLASFLGAWGQAEVCANFDEDPIVGPADLGLLLGAWGT